ncbi:kinase-like domain-containing protein [Dendryphion nanum]|uniref:non-specific serine/threonine protein kinase n=1 Tax=Dendryphion nanum TaxID=256645 RepID=A0A9P9D553_9PLEO|nr:kinase-like domain-containing protein [Dendryphion nanum]
MKTTPSPHFTSDVNPGDFFPEDHEYVKTIYTSDNTMIMAYHHTLSPAVIAVKQVHSTLAKTIPREVSILRSLPRHSAIIDLLDFHSRFPDLDSDTILYEHCAEGSMESLLENQITAGMPFTEYFLWAALSQLASALAFLHAGIGSPTGNDFWVPVIHGHVDLSHILVASIGNGAPDFSGFTVKLAGFGAARKANDGEAWNDSLDIEMWAPEVCAAWAEGEEGLFGIEADVWAVGAVMHKLVHGFGPENVVLSTSPASSVEKKELEAKDMLRANMILTPRFVIPVSFQQDSCISSHSRHPWTLPVYSGALDECVMLALEMNEGERIEAASLKMCVEDRHAEWLFEELKVEDKKWKNDGSGSEADSEKYCD